MGCVPGAMAPNTPLMCEGMAARCRSSSERSVTCLPLGICVHAWVSGWTLEIAPWQKSLLNVVRGRMLVYLGASDSLPAACGLAHMIVSLQWRQARLSCLLRGVQQTAGRWQANLSRELEPEECLQPGCLITWAPYSAVRA